MAAFLLKGFGRKDLLRGQGVLFAARPKKGPFQKDVLPIIDFQGRAVSFRGSIY